MTLRRKPETSHRERFENKAKIYPMSQNRGITVYNEGGGYTPQILNSQLDGDLNIGSQIHVTAI
jgi:hypothetical protein